MAWVILSIAGMHEVGWAVCLKSSKGFSRLWPTLGFAAPMSASVYRLGVSLKTLPLGTAYTVWNGVGAVSTVLDGVILLGKSADARRLARIGLILAGIVRLKPVSPL